MGSPETAVVVPEHVLTVVPQTMHLWVRNGQTRITLPQQPEPEYEADTLPSGYDYSVDLPIWYDPLAASATIETSLLLGDRLTWTSDLGHDMQDVMDTLTKMTALWRMALLDPAAAGLEPFLIDPEHYFPDYDALPGRLAGTYRGPETLQPLEAVLHPAWLYGGWGWKSPSTDPTRFGAVYLMPLGEMTDPDLLDDDYGQEDYPDITWGLYQVGLEEPLATAAWNDLSGCRTLVEQALSCEADEALVVRTLLTSDTEALREARQSHEFETTRRLSVERWDPTNRIRPILATRAIREVAGHQGLRVTSGHEWGQCVFWTRHQYAGDPVGEAVREIIVFHADTPTVQQFAKDLADKVRERQIGSVLVPAPSPEDENGHRIFLVKDVDFFREHAAAFRCFEDLTLVA